MDAEGIYAEDCMIENAADEYARRRAAAEGAHARSGEQGQRYQVAALILAAFLIYRLWAVMHGGRGLWLAVVAVAALVFCGVLLLRARGRANRAFRIAVFYEEGQERLSGRKTQSGHKGEAFLEPGHVYAHDLDVLGTNSVFGMLAITRTALGHRALAGWLLHPAGVSEAQQRQTAVQELAPAFELRERVALLGRSAFEQLPADSFERWLQIDSNFFPIWLRPVLILLVVAWIGVLLAGLLLHAEYGTVVRNLMAVLAVQGAIGLRYRSAVRQELEHVERLAGQTAILREGSRLLRSENFSGEVLRNLQAMAEGEDGALAALQRLLTLAEQSSKEWYYAPALLLSAGTQAAFGLQGWKRRYAEPMRRWLEAWSSFDALLALSTYAVEHPENVYPQFVLDENAPAACFVATGLKHPLLPRDVAVANDVTLNAETRFLLISGSNMAGKSTLLRAIGTNVILALTGLPVPADSLIMSALEIGAAIGVGDSLAERKSKFLAEVERLRAIVAVAESRSGHGLFLIDEIFSGTNSLDRQAAAEAVLRSLIEAGAVGALSTHDLTLAGLAEMPELHGRNVHMASRSEDDPLLFDYTLKPGVNRTTNALAIVRMLGLGTREA